MSELPPSSQHPLPANDPLRLVLHNEVHARPPARVRLPALITFVAVLNDAVTPAQECSHLSRLPGQASLDLPSLANNFLSLRLAGATVKWERHSEFSRYSVVQPLAEAALLGACEPDLLAGLALPLHWLSQIPGKTVAAIQLAMVNAPLDDAPTLMAQANRWLGSGPVVASLLGTNPAPVPLTNDAPDRHGYRHPVGHSWALTQFRLRQDGFERILVIAPQATSLTRAGRIAARLLELETYRLMALRGLPVAKALGPMLTQSEQALASITAQLENKSASDQQLLDKLVALAAGVESVTAQHCYRFSATKAYNALVQQRIGELRERAIPGTQTIGEFMQRRLSPAMSLVTATAQRLESLSQRVARTSDLLRTRVDIATEVQNQQLLEKLTRGQETQLRLQTTVEGLSIAAISYYVVSLLLYLGKALKATGLPINPELAAGALVPVVLWLVWRTTQKIHAKLHTDR